MRKGSLCWFAAALLLGFAVNAGAQQQAGSIRGVVYDTDFEAPLPLVQIMMVETGDKVTATEEGSYSFGQVEPGTYTLIFSKDGYTRQVIGDVVVTPGQLTDADAWLSGEFVEMEEFIVQDLPLGGASEAGLLNLRFDAPSLLDSVGAELMSQFGAGDAAAALSLVPGVTAQDGKYAVVRGLPDRYVSSQMNGVRLPTADPDKRAVELDQFPASVIESIQVTKTFTPDQQGDASGGAVNVILNGIPDRNIFEISIGTGINTQVAGRDDFLTYKGGGVGFWGVDDGSRDLIRSAADDNVTVGVSRERAPTNYDLTMTLGGRHVFDNGVKAGGFASIFYERDSSYFNDGVDDSLWQLSPGAPLTPQYTQGAPQGDAPEQGSFKTALFDVTQGSQKVKWGGLGAVGIESEHHELTLLYMYTRTTQDTATLLENTRGKAYYFLGYDRDDPTAFGNINPTRDAAPYLRTETLRYDERTTQTLQLRGKHTLPVSELDVTNFLTILPPEVDWTAAFSSATLYEPDKRQFGSEWYATSFNPGRPPFSPPSLTPAVHIPFKPAANFTLGNLQRTWKDISEDSEQYAVNVKFPFEQWSGDKGYVKLGVFFDTVDREYQQDSFSNFNDNSARYEGDFEDFWSAVYPSQVHPIADGPPFIDVDYAGTQEINAWYWMVDLPFNKYVKVIGGTRFESTDLRIINDAEADATWIPFETNTITALNPGDADVSFSQNDVLPSIGLVINPIEQITIRTSYSETVARQTFKELSPIQQQDYLGGDVFVGNPNLVMSALKNYDVRIDYEPYEGSLLSFSWFHKNVTDPIEYIQRNAGFTYTTAVNYPEGQLNGYEIEARQHLGRFWEPLEGLSVGANATFIDAEVTQPTDPTLGTFATKTRDMTNAPKHLYNLYLTYALERTGTQMGLFYTVRGDTLIAGASPSTGTVIPSVYQTEYGTLNFTVSQQLGTKGWGRHFKLKFSAKNLTNPEIEEVYRPDFGGGDVTKTSYRKGIDLSVSLTAEFTF